MDILKQDTICAIATAQGGAIGVIRVSGPDATPTDLISIDLHDCLDNLSEITSGSINTDEVLGNIFKNFCVGK